MSSNGSATGDLFYDDGESIDTIESKSYYYASFQYSTLDRRLNINVIENNYAHMSNLTLDSLALYGCDKTPINFIVDDKPTLLNVTYSKQIIHVKGLKLRMDLSHQLSWEYMNQTVSSAFGNQYTPSKIIGVWSIRFIMSLLCSYVIL